MANTTGLAHHWKLLRRLQGSRGVLAFFSGAPQLLQTVKTHYPSAPAQFDCCARRRRSHSLICCAPHQRRRRRGRISRHGYLLLTQHTRVTRPQLQSSDHVFGAGLWRRPGRHPHLDQDEALQGKARFKSSRVKSSQGKIPLSLNLI